MVGSRLPFRAYINKYTSVTGPITVYAKGCCARVRIVSFHSGVFASTENDEVLCGK